MKLTEPQIKALMAVKSGDVKKVIPLSGHHEPTYTGIRKDMVKKLFDMKLVTVPAKRMGDWSDITLELTEYGRAALPEMGDVK